MSAYKEEYVRYMKDKGIKYTEIDERAVRVSYAGDNMKSIPIIVVFDKDGGNRVTISCFEIGSFKGDAVGAGLITCNALNAKYRWVKFYLDNDDDVRVEADAIVDMNTVGAECSELVRRAVAIIDETYPEFMKAIWGSK